MSVPRRLPWILAAFAAVAVVALAVHLARSPLARSKLGALGEVGRTVSSSDHHHLMVIKCGGRVFEARHNVAVITRAAEYVGAIGSDTRVFLAIADAAAAADAECPALERLLDLAVRNTHGTAPLIRLAPVICDDAPPDVQARREAYLEQLDANAAYPTAAAALAARRNVP